MKFINPVFAFFCTLLFCFFVCCHSYGFKESSVELGNGSFERDGGWILHKHDGAEGFICYSDNARSGKRSLEIVKSNGAGFLQLVSEKPYVLEPGKYHLRAYYHTENSQFDSLLLLRSTSSPDDRSFEYNSIDRGRGLQSQSFPKNSNPGQWALRTATRQLRSTEELYISIIIFGNPMSVCLDDIGFYKQTPVRQWKPFVNLTEFPYTEEEVLKILQTREPALASLQFEKERAYIMLNGRKVIPAIYRSETYMSLAGAHRYKDFIDAAVPFVMCTVPLSISQNNQGVVKAPGQYDFKLVDTVLMRVLKEDPYARIIVSFDCNNPYIGWSEEYPDELWRDENGKIGYGLWGNCEGFVEKLEQVVLKSHQRSWKPWGYPSYSSPSYMAIHCKSLQELTEYLMSSPYGNAIAGFKVSGGHDTQFQYARQDHSQVAVADFQDFLRQRYKNIEKLNAHCQSNYQDFSQIKIPVLRGPKNPGETPLTLTGLWSDHRDFMSTVSWRLKHTFANTIRKALNNKQVIVFSYGNPPAFYPDTFTDSGDGVNIVCDQGGYGLRQCGFPVGWRLASTYALHQRMGLWELDLRTWTYPPDKGELYDEWIGLAKTAQQWQAIHRKFAGMALASNSAYWYYSMNRYFDDPEIMAEIKNVSMATQRIINTPSNGFRPDVCVVRSERGDFRRVSMQQSPNFPATFFPFELSGVPYDLHTLNDVCSKAELQNYKMYVFLHNAFISNEQRQVIAKKIKGSGRTLVFIYDSGVVDDEGTHIDNISKLTGFTILGENKYQRSLPFLDGSHPLGEGLRPMISGAELAQSALGLRGPNQHFPGYQVFSIQADADIDPFAFYQDGSIAAALRVDQGCQVFFLAAPFSLTAGLMNRLALRSGAFVLAEPGQSIHFNGTFLSLHGTIKAEKFTLQLPPGCQSVVDPFSGNVLAENCNSYTLAVTPGDSKWLLFMP